MKISSKNNLNIADELNDLSLSLNKLSYATEEKIWFFSRRVSFLIKKIDQLLLGSDLFSKDFLEDQKNKAISLYGRCNNLKIDSAVASIAKKAQKLSHTQPCFLEEQIKIIQQTLSHIKKHHLLSHENRKIIQFTELLIHSCHSSSSLSESEIDHIFKPIDTESAFQLFELAENLYRKKFHLAKQSFCSLAGDVQTKLKELLNHHGIELDKIFRKDLNNFEYRIKSVQVIIAFGDQLSLLQKEPILPSLEELQSLFNELED